MVNRSFTFHQKIFLGLRGFGYSIWIHSIICRCIPSGSVYFCSSLFFSFVLSPFPSTLLYLSLSLLFCLPFSVSLSSLSFSFFLSNFNLSLFYFILFFSLQHFIPTLLIFNLSLSLSLSLARSFYSICIIDLTTDINTTSISTLSQMARRTIN